MLHESTVLRSRGSDLLENLAKRGIAIDFYTAVMELVSNAHDADAHRIDVRLTSDLEKLVIEDDGCGMTEAILRDAFYHVGSDFKRTQKVSPGGRPYMGKFGIASLLLKFLGEGYTLETWRDGVKITMREDSSRITEASVPNGTVERWNVRQRWDRKKHGTRITIRDLKFEVGSSQFDLSMLERKLTWEMHPLPDLTIALNGKDIKHQGIVTYATEYDCDAALGKKLSVRGSLWARDKTGGKMTNGGGIRLYVNNRQVGDPRDFDLHRVDPRLVDQVLGIIHIDGMSDRIQFHRAQFLDSPEYQKVKAHVQAVLNATRMDLARGGFSNRRVYQSDRVLMQINEALTAAEKRLNTAIGDSGSKYKLKFDFGERAGPLATADAEAGVIYLNAGNPYLGRPPSGTKQYLEALFLLFSIRALSNAQATREFPQSAAYLHDLDAAFADVAVELRPATSPILDDLRAQSDAAGPIPFGKIFLNPLRLYTTPELQWITGRDQNVYKALTAAGTLVPQRHDVDGTGIRKYRGDQVLEVLKRIDGYIPAAEALDPKDFRADRRYSDYRSFKFALDRELLKHSATLPYLQNFGTAQPFAFAEIGREEELRRFARKHLR